MMEKHEEDLMNLQIIDDAVTLYEAKGEATLDVIEKNNKQSSDSNQFYETKINESSGIDLRIDETPEEADKNWAQAFYELEHNIFASLDEVYEIISKYKK